MLRTLEAWIEPFGLAAGESVAPEGFDEPFPPEILTLFETV